MVGKPCDRRPSTTLARLLEREVLRAEVLSAVPLAANDLAIGNPLDRDDVVRLDCDTATVVAVHA